MKKVLVIAAVFVVVIALLLWVVSWFRTPEAVATSGAHPWPGTMGPLESAAKRYPPQQENETTRKLVSLTNALPKSDAIEQFVTREITRGELTIGEPPALPDVAAIRELLLSETPAWNRGEGVGGGDDMSATRAMQMTTARALVASSLAKARANDAAAWEDLRAVWKLARSLDGEPQVMTQTAAFAMSRMINAVAWKMPLPAPEWLSEVQKYDPVNRLLEAFHYSAASYWADGAQLFPTKWLANSVEHDRKIAEALFKETKCDVNIPMNDLGVDLRFVWRRAFRYRAEREASANALRVREGKPIETTSQCSDGTWALDGTTLRFSREIAMEPPDRPMPLVLSVTP